MDPNDWTLTGNAGTNPSNNFLGTTDSQPLVIRTNGREAMRVTPDGKVGIGTATPKYSLSLFTSSDLNYLEVVSGAGDTNGGWFGTDGTDLVIQPKSGSNVVFYSTSRLTSSSPPLMVVQNDGNVGVGTAAPGAKLQITD